jgi:hypothetical protein
VKKVNKLLEFILFLLLIWYFASLIFSVFAYYYTSSEAKEHD